MRYAFPLGAVLGLLPFAAVQPAAAAPQSTTVPGISAAGHSIAKADDGSMWLTEPSSPGRVARVAPDGAVTEYSGGVTPNFTASRSPDQMAITADGYAWFLMHGGTEELGRISMSTGAVIRYRLTSGTPTSIAAGADGNLWFTAKSDSGADFIGRYNRVDNLTQPYSAGMTAQTDPQALAAGGDGALWFVEGASPGRVGRITTDGAITFRDIGGAPTALGAGPGGMWFSRNTELGLIGTDATTLFDTIARPNALATGPDGAVWSATTGGVVRVGPDGIASKFTAGIDASASGTDIVAGADGRMWMTLDRSPYLVRITVPPRIGTPTGEASSPTAATVTVAVRPNGLATTAALQLRSAGGEWDTLSEAAVGDALDSSPVQFDIDGLPAGSTNALRVVATNSAGAERSDELDIETEPLPTPTPSPTPEVETPTPSPTPEVETPTPSPTPEVEIETPTPSPTPTPEIVTPTPEIVTPTPEVITPTPKAETPTPAVKTPATATPTPTAPTPEILIPRAAPDPDPAPAGPTAVPAPVQGSTIVVRPDRGTVTYRVPGSDTPRPVETAASLPTGSIIDATKGAVLLSSQVDGDAQQGKFYGGEFKVKQVKATGMTQLYLYDKLDCAKPGAKAVRAAKGKKRRHVWGEDKNGRFETHGKDSVATVRGTRWLTTDTCTGTVVKVYEGEVSVRPRRGNGKAVIVKPGGRHVTRSK